MLFIFILKIKSSFLKLFIAYLTLLLQRYFNLLLPIYIELDALSFIIFAILFQAYFKTGYYYFIIF